jgi:hypothetical protein
VEFSPFIGRAPSSVYKIKPLNGLHPTVLTVKVQAAVASITSISFGTEIIYKLTLTTKG